MEITRNLFRHRLRSFLAISGMVIGIAALTTTGALAENFNWLLDGGIQYYGAKVQVGPPAGRAGSLLPLTKIDEIRQVRKSLLPFRPMTSRPSPVRPAWSPSASLTRSSPVIPPKRHGAT